MTYNAQRVEINFGLCVFGSPGIKILRLLCVHSGVCYSYVYYLRYLVSLHALVCFIY